MDAPQTVGRIFDIKRFAIKDGPGIRTTVFLKGCPLRCLWCHNPEGVDPEPLLSFQPSLCVGCGCCFRVCPEGAHEMLGGQHVLNRNLCTVCGLCAAECAAAALELVGREVTVAEVIDEVLLDRAYYEASGGGITLSGGEPTGQMEFAEALLRAAKEKNLHCCLDTCGFCEFEQLDRLRPLVDLFLYDYKETDPQRHVAQTGVDNEKILDNLHRLHAAGAGIRLRCPIIPGLNDRGDHFEGIARLAKALPKLEGVAILPYHRLGEGKVERMGLVAGDRPAPTTAAQETMRGWIDKLKALGVAVIDPDEG